MKTPSKKQLWVLFLITAFASPFIFFSTTMQPWKTTQPVLLIWQEITYPFEYGWYKTYTTVTSLWQTYINLHHAALENEELKQKLALLETRIIDYNHQIKEVSRLRKLLGFSQTYKEGIVVAEVITVLDGTPFQSIRIARGKTDGVRVGMPVVAAQGVIGRILRVGFTFSDVQLMSDISFNTDVILERTRTRGVLHGVGFNSCRLQLHRRADIRIGDSLVTSGIIGGFPKGLPIGKVTKIRYESDDVSQVITIQPWVDYRQLEEVVILKTLDPHIESIIGTAGEEWLSKTLLSKQPGDRRSN